MGRKFVHVDETEKRPVHNMKKAGITWVKMQEVTGRSSDTLQNVLSEKCPPHPATATKSKKLSGVKKDREHLKFRKESVRVKPRGIITKDDFLRLVKAAAALHKEVKGLQEVSVAMIKKRANVDACDKTCLEAFHADGIWFRPLKERPILSETDVKERDKWRKEKQHGSSAQWNKRPHATIDTKHFPLLHKQARPRACCPPNRAGCFSESWHSARELPSETEKRPEVSCAWSDCDCSSDQRKNSHVGLCRWTLEWSQGS